MPKGFGFEVQSFETRGLTSGSSSLSSIGAVVSDAEKNFDVKCLLSFLWSYTELLVLTEHSLQLRLTTYH